MRYAGNMPTGQAKHDSSYFLFKEAQKLGLEPEWVTDFGAFSVLIDQRRVPVFEAVTIINNSLSSFLARNKYLTRIVAQQLGLANIPFRLPQSFSELKSFWDQYRPLIAKPTTGWKGQNTRLVEFEEELSQLDTSQLLMESYVDGLEVRLVVLDGKVIAAQEKYPTPTQKNRWKKRWKNVAASAFGERSIQDSLQLCSALGLRLAAVDWIRDAQGSYWLLEVNSMPGLQKIHEPDEGEPIDAAALVWPVLLAEYRRQKLGWRPPGAETT